MRTNPFTNPLVSRLMLLALLWIFGGCGQGKQSLHEIDHVIPPHWPRNLLDNADKFDERLYLILGSDIQTANSTVKADQPSIATLSAELEDLIEWAPEVAADTTLTESQWEPVYNASEELQQHFPLRIEVVIKLETKLRSFSELIRQCHLVADRQLESNVSAVQTETTEPILVPEAIQ